MDTLEAPAALAAPQSPELAPMEDPLSRFDDRPVKEVKPETTQIDKPQTVQLPDKPDAKEEKAAPKPEDKKPAEKKLEKAETKPADKVEEVDTGKMAPKALREAYDKLKREMKEREAKHTTELDTARKSTAPKDDPEKVELSKRYEELEKRYKEKENHLRYKDYEASDEYQEKYKQPFTEKYQQAVAEISELKVANPDGTTRAANEEDFWKIVTIPNNEDALAAAEELFGSATKANFVIGLRKDVRAANAAMEKAKADYRKTGIAREQEQAKAREQREKQEYEQAVAQWENLNKGAQEKYPEWFTAGDDDEPGKEFLRVGYENVDKALGAENGMPREEVLARRAAVRNQAGAFRYMVHKWETTKARVAELEKELAEFRESQPKPGEAKSDKAKGDEMEDPFKKFDEM